MPAQVYTPKNETAFLSACEKIAKKLNYPRDVVAYKLSLDPKYYDFEQPDAEEYADKEFALGISDSQTYEDQRSNLQKAYGLTDDEVSEVVASEQHWAGQ